MTAKTSKPSYETEGTTVFMPYIVQTQLRGLLRTLTETGFVEHLDENDPQGITGPYIGDCISRVEEWLRKVGIAD